MSFRRDLLTTSERSMKPIRTLSGIIRNSMWRAVSKNVARAVLSLTGLTTLHAADSPAKKPNILWFVVDDMSANFSSYGETTIRTPNVDRLAMDGTRFTNAYVTAPVCSPCRSALITGMYQTSIGAHHHRSGRGVLKIQLPKDVVPLPKIFREAGYYTCIGSGLLYSPRRSTTHSRFVPHSL